MKHVRVSMFAALAGVLLAPCLAEHVTAQQKAAAGPAATIVKFEVKSEQGIIPLKREEQIAFMFVDAINNLQDDCSSSAAEPCTLKALGGFYAKGKFSGGKWYNPAGPATAGGTKITEYSVERDLFWMQ
jgi:hypothetical protein